MSRPDFRTYGAEADEQALRGLGRQLRQELGDGPKQDCLDAQKAALLLRLSEHQAGRRTLQEIFRQMALWVSQVEGRVWWRAGGLTAAACVLVVLVASPSLSVFGLSGSSVVATRSPLAPLEVRQGQETLAAGRWFRIEKESEPLLFSDGSIVRLSTGAQVRLSELNNSGAVMTLEHGVLDAQVTPQTGYQWTFYAGHYAVRVLGTVLRVEWEPETERLSVEVSRGKVRVDDDRHDDGGSVVVAGGRLVLGPSPALDGALGDAADVADSESSPEKSNGAGLSESKATESAGVNNDKLRLRGARRKTTKKASSTARERQEGKKGALAQGLGERALPFGAKASRSASLTSPADSSMRWRVLAQQGQYKKAIAAARTGGFQRLLTQLGAADLWRLADAARLAGELVRARRVLTTLRSRFPGHQSAHSAAYTLGRIAFDVRDYRSAISWFRDYLAGGRGASAEAAQGRLFIALYRVGQRGAALTTARRYLERYPNGANAAFARSLVAKAR